MTDTSDITDIVEKALRKFENHPSILKIKSFIPNDRKFEFEKVTLEEMQIEIHALKTGKAVARQGPPTKFVKDYTKTLAPVLQEIFNNEVIDNAKFSNKLKLADIRAIHKTLAKIYTKIIDQLVFCLSFLKFLKRY